MSRLLLLALLVTSLPTLADSIYRTTDAEGNVVFTDSPPAGGNQAEQVNIQRTNTTTPPPVLTTPPQSDGQEVEPEGPAYTVTITSPANETSFPRGPGNFSVNVRVTPALQKYEGLQLFLDGEPWGGPQLDTIWDLTNVFRGQHDLTVGVIDKSGETLAMSPPVRVFVHRPSINFKNK